MKLQLCAAGLLVLGLTGCSRTMHISPGATASDAAADGIRDVTPPKDAGPRDAMASTEPQDGASPNSHVGKPDDAGVMSQPKDAESSTSTADAELDAAPPMAADASSPRDPFGADEPEPTGPRIAIDFPPSDARTDRAELHVRGRLLEAKGGTLTLNGMSVAVDAAGAWSTLVQLTPGKNALEFELTLGSDRIRATRNVRSEPTLHYPGAVAIDSTNNRGYVADRDTLQSVDPETGERRLVSGPTRGQGPAFSNAISMIVDTGNHRAFIGAAGATLVTVDLESGDRRVSAALNGGTDGVLSLSLAPAGRVLVTSDIISWFDPATGNSTRLSPKPAVKLTNDPTWPTTIRSIVWRNSPEQAYVATTGGAFALYSTNLTTGASTLVADATHGSGPTPTVVSSLSIDPSADLAYIAGYLEGYEMAIVRVDLHTGDRALITHQSRGTGPNFQTQIALDTARGRLITPFLDGVLAVNLETGDRTVISNNQIGDRFPIEMARRLWLTPSGHHVLTMINPTGPEPNLFAIDLRSGERRVIVEHLPAGEDIAFDHSADPLRAVWVVDRFHKALWSVQLQDGSRKLASGQGAGGGLPLQDPQRVAYDATTDAQHAYVLDSRSSSAPGISVPSAIVRVDLMNGDRTIISDETTGTGPNSAFGSLYFDPKRKTPIALGNGDLLAIGSQTGERRKLASIPELVDNYEYDIVLDAEGDRMLIADAKNGLVAVALSSGAQTQLSAANLGPEIGGVHGLTTVPGRQLAILLCYGAVIVVDMSTGERVIVS
jgi:hypothetical protein